MRANMSSMDAGLQAMVLLFMGSLICFAFGIHKFWRGTCKNPLRFGNDICSRPVSGLATAYRQLARSGG